MTEFEYQMILYFDSTNNKKGYNQTTFTDRSDIAKENANKHTQKIRQKCAKVDQYNNIIEVYDSYHDAAEKNNYDREQRASSIRAICKGERSSLNGEYFRDLDENGNIIPIDFKRPHGKKMVICIPVFPEMEEKIFNSISEAAIQLKTDRQSIGLCISGSTRHSVVKKYIIRELDIYGDIIENNINIEEKIKEYQNKYPLINGERHSVPEWCKIYKITRQTVAKRIQNKNMDVVTAITTPPRRW